MNLTFACPECDGDARVELGDDAEAVVCPHCQVRISVPAGAIVDGEPRRCLVCPSVDLFVRKDFPQRLGVTIVVIGFAISCVTWHYHLLYWTFGVLFATAGIDLGLFLVMGEALVCYRCQAHYRGLRSLKSHGPFDLEVYERYRQQTLRLREAEARRTAAPVEHGAAANVPRSPG